MCAGQESARRWSPLTRTALSGGKPGQQLVHAVGGELGRIARPAARGKLRVGAVNCRFVCLAPGPEGQRRGRWQERPGRHAGIGTGEPAYQRVEPAEVPVVQLPVRRPGGTLRGL